MKPGFVRELYLRSFPSVDLKKISGQVDCRLHTIKASVYQKLIEEFCETQEEVIAANMFMLNSGLKIVEG